MDTATVVSAVRFLINYEHPTQVYRPTRPPKDCKFRKNWTEMKEIRGERLGAQKARIASLIQKFRKEDDGSGVSLIHNLRIQAIVVGLFGLNSHFSDFLDEDVLAHPGWAHLDEFSRPVVDKFTQAIYAFINGQPGDSLFDQADESFGRLRHALWCAKNSKLSRR